MIRGTGSRLEMLVATKSVYDQLKARGTPVTRQLLGETSQVQVHSEDQETAPVKERVSSVWSFRFRNVRHHEDEGEGALTEHVFDQH